MVIPQLQLLLWLLLPPALVLWQMPVPVFSGTASTPPQGPGCPTRCGNISIPYPFGLSGGCSWDESFTLTCNHSFSPPRLYLGGDQGRRQRWDDDIEVLDITVGTGEMRVYGAVSRICFNSSTTVSDSNRWQFDFTGTPCLVSTGRNEFTGIGCYTVAVLNGKDDGSYISGCMTTCTSLKEAASAGNSNGCTGLGCCQILTPTDLNMIKVRWPFRDHNRAWSYSPCSYAFVAEKGWYKFNLMDLNGTGAMAYDVRVGERSVPLVLDWAINTSRQGACVSSNSYAFSVRDGQGYRCNCTDGYDGNPYIKDNCTNVNECLRGPHVCPTGSKCRDTEGSYECPCEFGRRGIDCHPIFPAPAAAVSATFVASFLLALLVYSVHKDRKRRMRAVFFDKNGGKILKGAADIHIFTEKQLEKMTNHYSTLIGKGAFGMVFMGTTEDNQRVAVKRSLIAEDKNLGERHYKPQQGDDIVNEITFQFRNSHPNLVRLIGCCLETNIPVLVFEYISNGNLYNLLHVSTHKKLPLPTRLNIAIRSAEAIAYIHSSHGDHERIHGDVKSANILLDDDLMPKVSDFGSSKILSNDRYARAVAADMSYIDPVYMKTERFVAKSDVYSFSVVLLELITRKTVKYGRNKTDSLPMDFVKSSKEIGNAREMYDRDISSHDSVQCQHCIKCLDKIGALIVRCLREDVDERPTMEDVVNELKQAAEIVNECKQQEKAVIAYCNSCFEVNM